MNKKKKILFIEDTSSLQKAVAIVFEKDGYEILSALDGEEGLRIMKKEHPDVVLLDLILPKKDGFAVLEEMSMDPTLKNIPVVVLSNLGEGESIERALSLGAKMYLVKTDYHLDEVVKKIKQVLGEE